MEMRFDSHHFAYFARAQVALRDYDIQVWTMWESSGMAVWWKVGWSVPDL